MAIRPLYKFIALGMTLCLLSLILSPVAFDQSAAQSILEGTIPPITDLALEALTLEPTEILVGIPLTVTVVVRNVGATTVPGHRVYLYLNPAEHPPISTTQTFKEVVVGLV